MGDDYTGPVTVAADDGSERVLKDINVWQQSETIMEMVKGKPLAPRAGVWGARWWKGCARRAVAMGRGGAGGSCRRWGRRVGTV
eukprot:COSAG02_NODE_150_length_33596_cov_61.953966_29_plen_84_part_00